MSFSVESPNPRTARAYVQAVVAESIIDHPTIGRYAPGSYRRILCAIAEAGDSRKSANSGFGDVENEIRRACIANITKVAELAVSQTAGTEFSGGVSEAIDRLRAFYNGDVGDCMAAYVSPLENTGGHEIDMLVFSSDDPIYGKVITSTYERLTGSGVVPGDVARTPPPILLPVGVASAEVLWGRRPLYVVTR